MAGPSKRTRSGTNEPQEPSSPNTDPSSSTPTRRRQNARSTTPTRPIPTRPTSRPPTPLTRSTSQATISTRRQLGAFASMPSPGAYGSTLVRTQSQPVIPSMANLKASAAPGGSGRGKGEPVFDPSKGFGRGKENIPPKKDEEGTSRKRLRTGARSDRSFRRRSGSVSSMRSEGRISSAAPSSSSLSRYPSRLPSPSPSPSSFTSQSLETSTSVDPLDVLSEEMDLDKTPTKPKTRTRVALPTPPPSSPFVTAELEAATERISMVRVESESSLHEERDLGPYKGLKARLRLSNSANGIIGRQEEQKAIREYVASTYKLDVGMYVSGPPGTGKTATVTAMVNALFNEGWKGIEVCCMGLKAADIWRNLATALDCTNVENDVVAALQSTEEPLLLILDEIDSLMPPSPATAPPATSHLLSKIFSLPTTTSGRVKVIAISNTLDLTLRARLVLPDGATPLVLPFKAYAGPDMSQIVTARIDSQDAVKVDSKALELLTKKVEAQNGDLRMCLNVLTAAVSLAEAEWTKKVSTQDDTPLIKVSLAHVIRAFTTYTTQLKAAAGSGVSNSVTGKKVRSVPLQGKMVLVAMLVILARARVGLPATTSPTKLEALTTTNLYATYVHLLSHNNSPYPPSSESDYQDLLSNLEVLGLVAIGTAMSRTGSNSRTKASAQKIELVGREEEVREGLGLIGAKRGLAEEEVARIWEREEVKISRYLEKAKAKESADDPFL